MYRLGLDLEALTENDEQSIGWVTVYRVNGVLAMSRSIGDLLIKDLKEKTFQQRFDGELILAEPEVTVTRLDPADRFVVAATDGLWDVMTSQEVRIAQIVYRGANITTGRRLYSRCPGGRENIAINLRQTLCRSD